MDSREKRMPSKPGGQYFADAFAWVIAIPAAELLRFDFDVSRLGLAASGLIILALALVQLVVGLIAYLYRGRHPRASFAEMRVLLLVVAVSGAIVAVPVLVYGNEWGLPRSTVIIATPIALTLMAGVRYLRRLLAERGAGPSVDAEPALIYGAGYLGATIVRRMRTDATSPYRPVGLIDDDPGKQHRVLDGVRVLGSGRDLDKVASATSARVLLVTIARADAALLRRIADAAAMAGLRVKVLPLFDEVVGGRSRLKDIRDLSIEDVIGRHPVDTNVEAIAEYLRDRVVLVTGAGGSIGSELCRQIARFGPARLVTLDRDESALQATQILLYGHGLLDNDDIVLADIREADRIRAIMSSIRPDVVFHAAALKHLPILERFSDEAWKSNVLGTRNVLHAAREAGVTTFVNISTDKAANPTSVLGLSKRLAERLTAAMARSTGQRYLSVRFGNVLGSRGSMLPIFAELIEAGGPITITHPDVTRYFMTIPEACQLLVQAVGIGEPGEVLVLDMGERVRILDVADRMIGMSGRDVSIVFTGLRPGEKLHEELLGEGERDERPSHPGISQVAVPPITESELEKAWTEGLEKLRKRSHAGEGSA